MSNKVNQRLSSWKDCQPYFVGHLTLVKLVLQSLPSYVMQYVKLHISICEELDKKM
uniref:Uncharacterized protein n=1 Tax=Cajanus cajan TaxID=3821 RepID=A0A151RT40_CAJCA|nr:hypothetical protein KK1_032798 [Cajanus cajan]